MGVAKRRAVARARLYVEVDIPRLAAAMRKYAMAASDRLCSDSYIHAAIVREILAQIGFECHVVLGHEPGGSVRGIAMSYSMHQRRE